MKTKKLLFLIVVCIFLSKLSNGQGGAFGNFRTFGALPLGWTAGNNPGPLEIRNDFNQPINIYTNGSQRMSIRPNGRVGINSANRLSLRM